MAAETVIRAIITAVDRFSGPMGRIVASARGPVAAFGQMGPALANVSTQMGRLLGPVAAVGAAFTAAGLGKAVKDFSEYSSEVNDSSTRLGIAARALQEYRFAAGQVGVQQGTLDSGIEGLNKTMGDIAKGGALEAREVFRQLGITMRNPNGSMRDASQILPELIQGFERIQNPAARSSVAMAVFGGAGKDLLPLLSAGSGEIARLRAEAERLGIVLDDSAIAAGDDFGDTLDTLAAAARGLSRTIGTYLVPTLKPILEGLTEWIAANRVLIAQRVEQAVGAFAAALAAVNWDAVFGALQNIGHALVTVADLLGPTGTLVAGLTVAFAPLILAVGQLGWAFTGATVALVKWVVGMTVGPVIAAFVEAIQAGTGAMFAFNFALAANPIGLVITAIAALAGAAVLLYTHWEQVVGILGKVWGWIRQQIASLLETVAGFSEALADLLPDWLGGKGLKADIEQRTRSIREWGGKPADGAVAERRSGEGGGLLNAAPEQRVGGEIVIKMDNAPPGTRIDSVRADGGIDLSADIGRQPLPIGP
ncbi:phage tail tape measure protein [Ferrovibrio xuzhouensis]|uniref:Phage tail tape measure protein n=1 Tax=Ferrovibrio xuzhouensis TaxID=1576914 RepID=A0ABV7VC83_9PROT